MLRHSFSDSVCGQAGLVQSHCARGPKQNNLNQCPVLTMLCRTVRLRTCSKAGPEDPPSMACPGCIASCICLPYRPATVRKMLDEGSRPSRQVAACTCGESGWLAAACRALNVPSPTVYRCSDQPYACSMPASAYILPEFTGPYQSSRLLEGDQALALCCCWHAGLPVSSTYRSIALHACRPCTTAPSRHTSLSLSCT